MTDYAPLRTMMVDTQVRPNDVTKFPIIEAMLAILGDALAAGESLILPPLGRVRVNRTKEAANGAMLTIKLKRGGGVKKSTGNGDDDLAEPPE